ncbi:MAG: Na+/H+ antiporter [Candidatus Hydrogenedentota bacterium]
MSTKSSPKPSKKSSAPPLEEHGALEQFLHNDAAAAILLLSSAILAFICANSSFHVLGEMSMKEFYNKLWHMDLGIAVHNFDITQSLHLWINDGLMAIFFFLVGLEIKREMLVGELASVRKAALPIGAALGGMVCPAAIFALLNLGQPGITGWGIPMATDIAFAVGILGLLSGRVPVSLCVFLMALAIVDDLGAVLVIAVFYTESIAATQLFAGLAVTCVSFAFSYMGLRNTIVYVMLFFVIWITFLQSGVHATVAGVLFAFSIPVDARYETPLFISRIQHLLKRFGDAEDYASPLQVNAAQQHIIRAIGAECVHVEAPLQRIERLLHPYTAFLIMPIFAFANAGVSLDFSNIGELLTSRVTLGVMLGLLIGKQVGITGFSWIMVKLKLAELPTGANWKQLYAVSVLGSIGFTMSLFITELAYKPAGHGAHAAIKVEVEQPTPEEELAHAEEEAHAHDPAVEEARKHNAEAKLGVLLASIIAGIGGTALLYKVTKPGEGLTGGAHHGHGGGHHA